MMSHWTTFINWPYWGEACASFTLLLGIILRKSHLNTCLFLVKKPYKKYAQLFCENIRLPLQWILIFLSFLILLYHGNLYHVHSQMLLHSLQTILALLITWGIWRQTTNTKAWLILYSKEFNHSFHEIAVPLIRRGVRLLVVAILLVVLSSVWGFDAQRLLTGMGIIGLIVSFSAQDVIKNTFSGFILLFNKVFDLGDWIQVGQTSGSVESISLRFTKIRTRQHGVVTIPNSKIADSTLTNWSKRNRRYTEFSLTIDPNPSLSSLYKCIQHASNKLMLKEHLYPESIQFKLDTTGSSIKVTFSFDVRTTDFNKVEAIKLHCYRDISELFKHYQLIQARP